MALDWGGYTAGHIAGYSAGYSQGFEDGKAAALVGVAHSLPCRFCGECDLCVALEIALADAKGVE